MSTATRTTKIVKKTTALVKTESAPPTGDTQILTQHEVNVKALEIGRKAIKDHAKTWEELARY